jgi:DNA-binding transcriptional MerR regulator
MSRRKPVLASVKLSPEPNPNRSYTIGELATELGITTRTIRFYEQKKLIQPARKGIARTYDKRDRARMLLILRGKNLGFSLEDIAEFLALYDADPDQVAQTRMLLDKVSASIAKMQGKKADIERVLNELTEIQKHCQRKLGRHGA